MNSKAKKSRPLDATEMHKITQFHSSLKNANDLTKDILN